MNGSRKQVWLHITLLLAAILIAYYKVLHAPFSVWDDDEYVFNNPDIQGLDADKVHMWFSHYYVGNYAPLTMLTYAADFAIGKLEPLIYHLTNLVLHSLNAILLYLLVLKVQKNNTVALFTSLLFALAPVQTEGVTWISERKTLLCAFFYLLALLQYARYVAAPKPGKLFIVIILGIAAMLSKGIAMALPLSMLAMDIWLQRDLRTRRVWLEKIPLLAAAVCTGLVAVKAEAAGNFLGLHPEYHGWDSFVLAGYSYIQYICKLLVPVHQSLYYPYPETVGLLQYAYLLIAIGIAVLFVVAWRKKWYILCGSIAFYTVNIALVLQFVQFSFFLRVDHYSYIASIGVFFPLVYLTFNWLHNKGRSIVAVVSFTCVSCVFLVTTFIRNDIWLSDINFVNSLLDDFPASAVAQYTAGALYMKNGDYKEASKHFNKAVALEPRNHEAWYNKGALALREGKVTEALEALNKCLDISPYPPAYFSRALLYMGTGKYDLALANAEKTLAAQPENARAWYIKGYCMEQQGNLQPAIDCYSKAILLEDNEPLFYLRRGKVYAQTNQNQYALNDLNKALALDPANGEAFYYRGVAIYNSGKSPCPDFHAALSKGYKVPADVMQKLCTQ